MRLRLIAAVAASMLLSALLAACGSGGSGGSGAKTLTYWATNQGLTIEHDTKILTPELQPHRQLHPDPSVDQYRRRGPSKHHRTTNRFVQYIEVHILNGWLRFSHGPARRVRCQLAPPAP